MQGNLTLWQWFTSSQTWGFIGTWGLIAIGAALMYFFIVALPKGITDKITAQDNLGRIGLLIGVVLLLVIALPGMFTLIIDFVSSGTWLVALVALGLIAFGLIWKRLIKPSTHV